MRPDELSPVLRQTEDNAAAPPLPNSGEARRSTRDLTSAGLRHVGIDCSAEQLEQLMRFRDVLLVWNAERMNLTRLTAPEEIASEHFLDSASLLGALSIPSGSMLLDVGAGAGFPSIPIAILRPDLQITLMEATGKKLAFCEAAASAAAISSHRIRFVHGRAEDEALRRKLGRRFDVVTARAVAPLVKLAQWCAPYLKPTGRLAALKGARATEEVEEARRVLRDLGLKAYVRKVSIPGSHRAHNIVICSPMLSVEERGR